MRGANTQCKPAKPQPTMARRRELIARFHGVPFIRHLGMNLKSLGRGTATIGLTAKETLHQYQGLVHGGAVSSLADTAATFAVLTHLPEKTDVVTVEFKLNFLAPLKKGQVTAVARTVRLGRRIAVAEVEVRQHGEASPSAIGLFTMIVFATE